MKKEVRYILLVAIMIICVNSTNVGALENSINLDNTGEKEAVIASNITSVLNDTDSSSLNNSSDITNEEQDENIEENDEPTNNDELLTLDELNKLNEKLEFTEETLIVKGNLFDYTNTTFIKEIINEEEIISKYNCKTQIIDKDNNIIVEDVIIDNEYYLVFKDDKIELKFKIEFLFDFDQNYIVDENDKVELLELLAEDSTIIESKSLSYFDYVLKNKTYDVSERGDISLDMEITTDKDRYDYGNEFDVIITNPLPPTETKEEDEENSPEAEQTENNNPVTEEKIEDDQIPNENPDENLEKDPSEEETPSEEKPEDKKIYINIISGKIDYNHDALKLLSIAFEDYENLSTEEDSYLFWVDNLETIRILLRFKAINQNSREYITIYESDICSEGKEIETETMHTKVILNKIPKPTPPKEEYKVNKPSKKEEKIIPRKKSTDSYASKIDIKNHLIGFDYLIKNYTINADYSETSLDFDIILHDKKYATYEISGNNNFKVGENLVVVTVTAEDGSKTDYKFNVIRMPKVIINDKKTNNIGYDLLSMNIFLGTLIVAIGLIYKIFDYKLNR